MFKPLAKHKITAEEIKNRILAYASLQAAQETLDENYWYGNISTYTLNLRLSGIYGEKSFNDVLSSGADTTLNISKYPYLANEVFLKETQHLDDLNFVKQLYQAFLAREADPGGLEGNVNQLKNGAIRENLIIGLRNSGEADGVFLRVTDCLDNEHFLEIAHRVYLEPENRVLRWSPDLQSLHSGVTREAVFQDLKQFQLLQTALQHRQGDFYRPDSIFLQNTQQMSDEDFVKELYLTYCKREADPGGLAGNVEQLNNGVSRLDLLSGLRTSEEAANVFVDLTAGLDDATFIAIAYLAYRKEELTPQKKQQCLQILETGNIRQTVLREELIPPTPPEELIILKPVTPEEITPSPLKLVLEQLQSNFALEDEAFLAQAAQLNHEDFVRQLYLNYLQRETDPDGLAGNLQQLNSGVARGEILCRLRTSEEAANVFVDLTANLDNVHFIELAYKYYRKQELTASQEAQDLDLLESGAIRQVILQNISLETPTETLETITFTIQPEKPSITSLEQLLAELKIADRDYITQTENLSDREFIQQVYQTFFRREADPEGLTSHTEQLKQGIDRWDILYDLRTSEEAANVFVEITAELDNSRFLEVAYEVYLKQQLDPENKIAYLEYLEQGNPRQNILS